MTEKGGTQGSGESGCPQGSPGAGKSASRPAAKRTLSSAHSPNIYRRLRLSLAFQG